MNSIRKPSRFAVFLAVFYALEPLFGKSQLADLPYVWVIHMILGCGICILLFALAFISACNFSSSNFPLNRNAIFISVLLIGVWGIIAALYQDSSLSELLYIINWELMVITCWVVAPPLLNNLPTLRFIKYLNVPLKLALFASLFVLLFDKSFNLLDPVYRPKGIFVNTTSLGDAAIICCLLSTAQLSLKSIRHSLIEKLTYILPFLCLLLTKSRIPISATFIAVFMAWLIILRPKAKLFLVYSLLILLFFFYIVISAGSGPNTVVGKIATILRIKEVRDALDESRMTAWTTNYDLMIQHPTFGMGFTTRWTSSGGLNIKSRLSTDGDRDSQLEDINPSLYDPHNFFLTFGKSLGILGLVLATFMILSIIFMGTRILIFHHIYNNVSAILVFELSIVLFILSATSDPLISFGSVFDRFAWILLGVVSFNYNMQYGANTAAVNNSGHSFLIR